jgi:soluble lytic murein transglycosylase-like protein
MALSEQEFAELQALVGGAPSTKPSAPVSTVGGGRGVAQLGTTSPNQQIAAQRQYEQEQQLTAKKKALAEQGWLGYTAGNALDVLTGRGEGNIASNLVTGGLTRAAAALGSQPSQQELTQAEMTARREKQLQEDLYGPQTFAEKVGSGLSNVARYATQEPGLFTSQMASGLADPAALALGGLGAPIKGAGTAVNLARAVGGGAAATGAESLARSFGQGATDAEQAAQEAAMGGILSGIPTALGGVISAPGKAIPRTTGQDLFTLPERMAAQKVLAEGGGTLTAEQAGGVAAKIGTKVAAAGAGTFPLMAVRENAGKAIISARDKIIENIAKNAPDALTTGTSLNQIISAGAKALKTEVKPFFDNLDTNSRGITVKTQDVWQPAREAIDNATALTKSGKAVGIGAETLSELQSIADLKNNLTFGQAHEFASNLKSRIRELSDETGATSVTVGKLRKALGSLEGAMDDAAKKLNPDFKNKYDAVIGEYRKGMSSLYPETLATLVKRDPEKIGQAITQTGNETKIKAVFQALNYAKQKDSKVDTEAVKAGLRKGYLEGLLAKKLESPTSVEEATSILGKFKNIANSLEQEKVRRTFDAIFESPEHKKMIDDLLTAAKVASSGTKPSMLNLGSAAGLTGIYGGSVAGGVGLAGLAAIAGTQLGLGYILSRPSTTRMLLSIERMTQKGQQSAANKLANKLLTQLETAGVANAIQNAPNTMEATQVAPMPETTTQPAAPQQQQQPESQGLSDAEFEELKKELQKTKQPQKQQVSSIIEDEAARLGIPEHVDLLTKLAKQESGFKQSAVSPKGAIGVMQLMPATAQELGVDPTDLEQNVRGGVRYWAKQLKFFNGDTRLATAAYNAGAGNVIKAGNQVPNFKETQNYVAAIVG